MMYSPQVSEPQMPVNMMDQSVYNSPEVPSMPPIVMTQESIPVAEPPRVKPKVHISRLALIYEVNLINGVKLLSFVILFITASRDSYSSSHASSSDTRGEYIIQEKEKQENNSSSRWSVMGGSFFIGVGRR